MGRLRPVPQAEARPARSLFWLRANTGRRARPTAYRLGRYKLHDFTFFGHVALDAAVPAMLQELGHGWRPADPLLGADGQPVAAIWQDSDGNVFLPFDPGEVMHRFWSEGYRNVGRSALIGIGHAVSLRGYYLARPVLPRPFSCNSGVSLPGYKADRRSRDGPLRTVSTTSTRGYSRDRISPAAPVPFLDLWPEGRSWALVLTHDVETDAGQPGYGPAQGPRARTGLQSSWNFVALRYRVGDDLVRSLQAEGCEVGVHGLRHDGRDLVPSG